MKTKILRMLRNADGYISGQEMCDQLGISRTAVWKWMNQLKQEGYVIEAVQNKGYHIEEYPDVITDVELESMMKTEEICHKVIYFDETDSTNNQAKKAAENGAEHGTLVVAEVQDGGRGRRGRQWLSPRKSGIWMSLILRPEIAPYCASMLTLVAAMAVAKAIQQTTGENCSIKWPNDIVMNNKKICGILTEMSAEPDVVNYVVVGIGINVNTTVFDESIRDMASSLLVETKQQVKRSTLIEAFAEYFEQYYQRFLKTEDLSALVDEYNALLINAGRQVKISDAKETFTAKAIGIDHTGELLVEKEDGSMEKIIAGEVSVRGLYGYV